MEREVARYGEVLPFIAWSKISVIEGLRRDSGLGSSRVKALLARDW